MEPPANGQFRREMLKMLYDNCYDRVFSYCVHRVFSRAIAEDITSEIFLSAARAIGSVRGRDEQDYTNWLFSIAANQCNSYWRKNLRRRELFEKYQQESAFDHHQDSPGILPDWPSVYGAMSRLKEIEQTIITLRFFEALSYEDIAAVTHKRPSSVRVILHRGLKKLRQLLNPADGGFE